MDPIEIARKMRGPEGAGRVLVLDVDHSSRKYRVWLRERASRHAYYLRPAEGMDANDLKRILDEAGRETELGFRYYVYPELDTDMKPLLSADPYAEKHFERNDDRRFLQIEGERPMAREAIARLLDGLKEPFNADEFPRISEFVLESFRPISQDRQAEVVLLRKDRDKNELRKAEPGFHIAVAEHGFAREIEIHRPVLAETEPVLFLNSNESTGCLGHEFLSDLVTYFGSSSYFEQSSRPSKAPPEPVRSSASAPSSVSYAIRAPRIQPPALDGDRLLALAATAMKDQFPHMKLLKKRQATCSGPHIVIRFPGVMGFGKGPSEREIKELKSIYRAISGDPALGSDWHAQYQIDQRTGEVRVVTSFDPDPPKGWTALRH